MANEKGDKTVRSYTLMRSVVDYTMAILYLGVGLFLFFPEKVGFELDFDKTFRYIFGSICILYGAFRLYRGFRKEY
jgi:hypothetical protein